MSHETLIRFGSEYDVPPQGTFRILWGYDREEGKWFINPTPTREQLVKHAEKFGVDQVAETAAEIGFSLEDLTFLIEQLDRIDIVNARKLNRRWGKSGRRQSAEVRAKKLLNWVEPEEESEAEAS